MRMPSLSRQDLSGLVITLWAILVGGVRIFAWDSLKSGFIDVRPLPRVPRTLALLALALVFIFIASILYKDALRLSGELEPLPLSSAEGRGFFVPALAVPIAFLTTIFAWTLLLTGALHVMGWVRWSALLCFLFFGVPGLLSGSIQIVNSEQPILAGVIVCLVALVFLTLLLLFILLPRLKMSLAFEFTLLLGCIGGLYVLMMYLAAQSSQASSVDFVSGYLVPSVVTNPRNMIFPFLYLAGADLLGFGATLTGWATKSAQRFGNRWIYVVLLLALLVYRWFTVALNWAQNGISEDQWLAWAGAALAGCALIPIAIWRVRQPFPDRVPLKLIVGLIVLIVLPQQILVILVGFVSVLFLTQMTDPNVLSNMTAATTPLLALSEAFVPLRYLLLVIAGIAVAYVGIQRKRFSVAAFGMILAWTQFVWFFMLNGQPLQEWRYFYSDLGPFIFAALSALTLVWLTRGALTEERALKLLALTFFAWVLNFTDFLDNPLSLFFAFAGIFFTAFGILWGVLTAGGKFANYDSLRFPRINRILLYLGYALLTLNITHWFTVTQNVIEQTLSSGATTAGLRIFGLTIAYVIFVEGGWALLKQET